MQTRQVGSLDVSVVGLGCNNFGWRLDAERTATVVDAALEAGIDFFDTADMYGAGKSEEYLGRALAGRRDQVVIATKFGFPMGDETKGGAKADYVRRALDASLRRLQTDHVDLYQIHRPDPETPIAETLAVLDELVRAGKVREIGCSNFSLAQLREAEAAVRPGAVRFVSVQNEYSLLHRDPERDVLPECGRTGMAFLPYFPLASGLLTGKYRRGEAGPSGARLSDPESSSAKRMLTERNLAIVEALSAFAASKGCTLLELAIAWLAAQRGVASVIAGATSPEQVRANVGAAGLRLGEADLAKIDELTAG